MPSRRRPRTLALGVWLAARGGIVKGALALSLAGAVVAVAAVLRAEAPAVGRIPMLASEAIAWGAGVMVAFGAALQAAHRDRAEGVIALLRSRGVRAIEYVRGRVGGLVVLLGLAVGGPALLVGITATIASPAAARASLGGLAYALAFSLTLGALAMATLGARSRMRGYLALLAVLVGPELFAPWTSAQLPDGWHELTSVPAALAALGAGIASPATAGARPLRAFLGLAVVVMASITVVFARAQSVDPREDEP